MSRLPYQHQEQPRPLQHAGSDRRASLIVSSEPVLLGKARQSYFESMVEPTRLLTAGELLEQAPFQP